MPVRSNKLTDVQAYLHQQLTDRFDEFERGAVVRIVLEDLLGLHYPFDPNALLTESELVSMYKAKDKLLEGVPVQYVAGQAHFYGRQFKCDQRALIPRSETEQLVRLVLQKKRQEVRHILDIGTGTGCIPITLVLESDCHLTAWDVSQTALELAQLNAKALSANVELEQVDVLQTSTLKNTSFDLVVSNPPYVLERDRMEMDAQVLDHEPELALFVPDEDPLKFYTAILQGIERSMPTVKQVFFEIHYQMGKRMQVLAETYKWDFELLQDIDGKDRFVVLER